MTAYPGLIDEVGDIPYWATLGVELIESEVGHVRMRLPMAAALATLGNTMMHGGAIASLIDISACVARTTRGADEPPWAGTASTDMNVSYLAAATTDLIADARVLRVGGTRAFVDVRVHDANDELVALGRVTVAIRRS